MDFASLGSQFNAGTIWPEAVLILTILVILVGDIIQGRSSSAWTPYAAIAGCLATVVTLAWQWNQVDTMGFLGAFNADRLSIVFRGIIALSAAVTVPMAIRYIEQSGTALAEFLVILLTATLGVCFSLGPVSWS
jgi:NAD(P)H-quinone oxidoreductase subunit 2